MEKQVFEGMDQNVFITTRKSRSIKQTIILLLTNLLLLSGLVFLVEIILIILGVGNVSLPLTHKALELLQKIVF
ncbi:MAG: hypothetical protein N2053_07650 [Chitinispirillaceae bacterium]|nr:hypothetical protein [Chitinispirillaceae bacterium]